MLVTSLRRYFSAGNLPSYDCYKLFGLSHRATDAEIKQAYFKLAKECHPDSSECKNNIKADFAKVSEAYETLSKNRKSYDAYYHSEGLAGGMGSSGKNRRSSYGSYTADYSRAEAPEGNTYGYGNPDPFSFGGFNFDDFHTHYSYGGSTGSRASWSYSSSTNKRTNTGNDFQGSREWEYNDPNGPFGGECNFDEWYENMAQQLRKDEKRQRRNSRKRDKRRRSDFCDEEMEDIEMEFRRMHNPDTDSEQDFRSHRDSTKRHRGPTKNSFASDDTQNDATNRNAATAKESRKTDSDANFPPTLRVVCPEMTAVAGIYSRCFHPPFDNRQCYERIPIRVGADTPMFYFFSRKDTAWIFSNTFMDVSDEKSMEDLVSGPNYAPGWYKRTVQRNSRVFLKCKDVIDETTTNKQKKNEKKGGPLIPVGRWWMRDGLDGEKTDGKTKQPKVVVENEWEPSSVSPETWSLSSLEFFLEARGLLPSGGQVFDRQEYVERVQDFGGHRASGTDSDETTERRSQSARKEDGGNNSASDKQRNTRNEQGDDGNTNDSKDAGNSDKNQGSQEDSGPRYSVASRVKTDGFSTDAPMLDLNFKQFGNRVEHLNQSAEEFWKWLGDEGDKSRLYGLYDHHSRILERLVVWEPGRKEWLVADVVDESHLNNQYDEEDEMPPWHRNSKKTHHRRGGPSGRNCHYDPNPFVHSRPKSSREKRVKKTDVDDGYYHRGHDETRNKKSKGKSGKSRYKKGKNWIF